MIAAEQNFGHTHSAKLLGPRIMRILQQPGTEGFFLDESGFPSTPGCKRATASISTIAGSSPPEST